MFLMHECIRLLLDARSCCQLHTQPHRMNRHAIGTGSKSSFNLVPLSACNAAMRFLLDTPHLRPYTVGLRARCWRARVEAMLLGNAGGAAGMCRRALGEEDEVGRLGVASGSCCLSLSLLISNTDHPRINAGDRRRPVLPGVEAAGAGARGRGRGGAAARAGGRGRGALPEAGHPVRVCGGYEVLAWRCYWVL